MDKKRVLIQILNYRSADLTMNLINELEGLSYSNYKILVIDNCSPDNSVELLSEYKKRHNFHLIVNKKNTGYASGNNLGLRYSIAENFDYTWILNSDLKIVDKSVLSKLVSCMDMDSNIAGCGPQIVDINGFKISPYINRPSFTDLSYGLWVSKKKRHQISYSNYTGPVYRVYGCCMLVNNETMHRIGLFDERTFLYFEEEILAEKFLTLGKTFYHTSNTEVIHLESMTVHKEFNKRNWKKASILQKSFSIYLKDYRRFNSIQSFLCKVFHEPLFLFF